MNLPFSIFQYSSPLEFLQDAYDHVHTQDETFSYDKIAQICGLRSRTQARNIFKGTVDPTSGQIQRLATCFGLDSDEQLYLACLFQFKAVSATPAAYSVFQSLVSLQQKKLPSVKPFREAEVATSLLHMTLLSTLDLPAISQTPESLFPLLKERYPIESISAAILDLEQLNFIYRDRESGRWLKHEKNFKKFDFGSNFFLKRFHHQCLDTARESLDSELPDQRYLVGASFCINHKVFPRIVQKLNAFLENLMHLEGVAGSPDTVVQINSQLVRMTALPENPATPDQDRKSGLDSQGIERALPETENNVIAR